MGRGLRSGCAVAAATVGVLVLVAAGPAARPAATPPPGAGACGVPAASPVWIDYADGAVQFWQQLFARPGIVAAASNTVVPPQERQGGAASVYFDLKFPTRVGQPSKPLEPDAVQAMADKVYGLAVASTGCATPIIAENELFGADLVTPWSPTNTQYRANVLAYLGRLAEHGASPYLLVSKAPFTDGDAGVWWQQVAKVASIVPEVYFNAPRLWKQGTIVASRTVRVAFRNAIANYTTLGIPAARVGLVLGFQVAPGAGGREHLQPASAWFDVVKWQALAAKQVASETGAGTIWSWGWGTWSEASTDADKPVAACVYLWVRSPALCDGPAAAGDGFDASLTEGQISLPGGTRCTVAGQPLTERGMSALAAVTGDADLAESALFARLATLRSTPVSTAQILAAERAVVAGSFGGSRAAYLAALAKAHATLVQARAVIGDELRRAAVSATLPVPAPSAAQIADFYATYATARARPVRVSPAQPWLGNRTTGWALEPTAPPQVFSIRTGAKTTLATPTGPVSVQATDDTQQLGELPVGLVRDAVVASLRSLARDDAYGRWLLGRENAALATTVCRADVLPALSEPELEDYLPFLAF